MTLTKRLAVSLAFAALAGFAHLWLLGIFWTHWSLQNPLVPLVVKNPHIVEYYQWILRPTDFLTSVTVSLPFAALLFYIRPSRPWLYTFVATLPAIVYTHWPLVLSDLPGALWLVLMQFAWLPTAMLIVQLLARRFAPNNSFKPKLLRSGNSVA